jgi:RNA-binding protein
MQLTEHQKKSLRGMGHRLKPVVTVGAAGITETLLAELLSSLEHHELMKVRINAADRSERDAVLERLCGEVGAQIVQRVGHVALLLRIRKKKSRLAGLLSNIR